MILAKYFDAPRGVWQGFHVSRGVYLQIPYDYIMSIAGVGMKKQSKT